MGFFDHLLGNATTVDINELRTEFEAILFPGEELECAFRIFRDKWVFTNKRLIMLNVQGLTGKKREYHSIPYRAIQHFSIETAGTLDDDCEMKIWLNGTPEPFVKEFSRDIDLKAIQQTLARHVTEVL